MNGERLCFGVSEHVLKEYFPILSEKAQKEIKQITGWLNGLSLEQAFPKPASDSTFNELHDSWRAKARIGIAMLLLREMPIKNFYARSTMFYFLFSFGVWSIFFRGENRNKAKVVYNHEYFMRPLRNHPDLFWWTYARKLPTLYIREDTHMNWRTW
jgi:hypothetical protein